MPILTAAEVLAQLNWRCAVKRFDPARVIPADTWTVLEQSLVLAPSSFNLQPWKFVVGADQVLRDQLRVAGGSLPVDPAAFAKRLTALLSQR
jgi:nitroreductase